jgi:hypothetical protein
MHKQMHSAMKSTTSALIVALSECPEFLPRFLNILGQILGPEAGYIDLDIPRLFSVAPSKCCEIDLIPSMFSPLSVCTNGN